MITKKVIKREGPLEYSLITIPLLVQIILGIFYIINLKDVKGIMRQVEEELKNMVELNGIEPSIA